MYHKWYRIGEIHYVVVWAIYPLNFASNSRRNQICRSKTWYLPRNGWIERLLWILLDHILNANCDASTLKFISLLFCFRSHQAQNSWISNQPCEYKLSKDNLIIRSFIFLDIIFYLFILDLLILFVCRWMFMLHVVRLIVNLFSFAWYTRLTISKTLRLYSHF